MIVLTGAAGFIGSGMLRRLNDAQLNDILIVDQFGHPEKDRNLVGKSYAGQIERTLFIDWFKNHYREVEYVFHLGARTDTAEKDQNLLDQLNREYTKEIWQICALHQIPLLYASSAATYGGGELGFQDSHTIVDQLQPLNAYAISKNEFDKLALQSEQQPPHWVGLKFFNVYGPNEYHKDRMSSVIQKAYHQIKEKGQVKLFRSHNEKYVDGEQYRDFVYVKDVTEVCYYFMQHQNTASGLYNVGSAKARTFLDLANATFSAMNEPINIEFIDIPKDIREHYQYFTEANIDKLRNAAYKRPFHSLEEGIKDYVQNYLSSHSYW